VVGRGGAGPALLEAEAAALALGGPTLAALGGRTALEVGCELVTLGASDTEGDGSAVAGGVAGVAVSL
jgi:hypothetical protein